jgi:hypothetical protein
MKAIIQTKFYVREKPCTSYYSFPVYSDEIEKTLCRELEFLQRQGSSFSLELKITEDKAKQK